MSRKLIFNLSNEIIREFDLFNSSIESIKRQLKKIQEFPPKSKIEKRIIQRVSCIVGGFLKSKEDGLDYKPLNKLLHHFK